MAATPETFDLSSRKPATVEVRFPSFDCESQNDLNVELPSGEVHVWVTRLGILQAQRQKYFGILSLSERERALRFQFEEHRHAYIVSHGWLRTLLARYVDAAPSDIEFVVGVRGKPSLVGSCVHFNLSHSGDLAVCAIVRDAEVGIDVEAICGMENMEEIARGFFSPRECQYVLALQGILQTEAFFRCWTRKEAYVKAVGDGLHIPLRSFEVTLRSRLEIT